MKDLHVRLTKRSLAKLKEFQSGFAVRVPLNGLVNYFIETHPGANSPPLVEIGKAEKANGKGA